MESYIVRIYRRDAEKVAGLIINATSGKEQSFQSLQQLGQRLDISDAADGLEKQPEQNSNNCSEKESS